MSTRRYILTGTAGAGKTSVLRYLETQQHCVIEEAATDVIALEQAQGNREPWREPAFIDKIITLQRQRQELFSLLPALVQFFDRSPIDAYALCRHMGFTPSPTLLEEIARIRRENIYQRQVFFIENLGFCEPTEARRISFEDALRFEKIHEEAFTEWGYELVRIPAMPIADRAQAILRSVGIG